MWTTIKRAAMAVDRGYGALSSYVEQTLEDRSVRLRHRSDAELLEMHRTQRDGERQLWGLEPSVVLYVLRERGLLTVRGEGDRPDR